ncbi:mitoguardin isoform X8 [Dermacentor albipictus]|uniref:mitoguardin isoform X8 n=1 Tax=Dermacentor albipictus TaxID=60249 RepID=UPI0038FC8FDA
MLQVTPRVSFPMNDAPRRSKIIIASAGIGIILLGVLTRYLRRRFVDFKSAVVNGEVANVVWCGRCRCGRRTSGPRGSLRALQGPTAADRASMAHMGPQQLASLGLDSLDQVISYWEQALQRIRTGGSTSGNESLATSLEFLLVEGQRLRGAAHWRLFSEGGVPPLALDEPQLADFTHPPSLADTESFVSAEGTSDVAVVADLEASPIPPVEQSALYMEALELLKREGIPCRTYRVEVVRCSSREDYLAKIHCIRLAFKRLTNQPDVLQWLIEAANHVLGGFMLCAGKDPKDALHAYRELVAYLLDSSHYDQIAKELQYKGVVCPTVYDVVIDYVLLDAFDDLSSPPQSVVAVIQNRWLTAGFKETDEVEALVCDMFDPSCSRYSSVDDLAQDILQNSQLHYDRLCQALAGALLPDSAPP